MAVTLPPNFNFPGAQQGVPQGVFNLIQSMSGMGGGGNALGGGLSQSIGQLMNPTVMAPINSGPLPTMPAMPVVPKAPVIPKRPTTPDVPPVPAVTPGQFTMDEHGFLVAPKGGRSPSVGGMRIKPMVPAAAFNKMGASDQQRAIATATERLNMQRINHR